MECWVSLKLFFGNPMQAVLLLASAIYITVTEKDMRKKILLGVMPIVIIIGFLLPITKIVYVAAFNEGSDTYYRIMWLIPMYVVEGYAACSLIFSMKDKVRQRIALVVTLVVVAVCGSLVYLNQYVSVAQNLYHIPQSVVNICDRIAPEEGEDRVRAAFPSDLVHFVRQYDTNILMPYGREMLATQWDYYNVVYEVMEKPEVIIAKDLLEATRQTKCSYIILSENRKIDYELTDFGLELIDTIDGYHIYADPEVMGQG